MAQVFGVGIDELQKTLGNNRYFYGLRRTSDGTVYMVKADLLELEDGVELNRSGNIDDNYNNWSRGEDFFEGRDTQHKLVYKKTKHVLCLIYSDTVFRVNKTIKTFNFSENSEFISFMRINSNIINDGLSSLEVSSPSVSP